MKDDILLFPLAHIFAELEAMTHYYCFPPEIETIAIICEMKVIKILQSAVFLYLARQ